MNGENVLATSPPIRKLFRSLSLERHASFVFLRRQWKGHGGKASGGKGHGKSAKGGNTSQNNWQASTPLAFAHALRIFAFRAFAGPQ